MFITFEGLDGSGKTTQARLLGARLEAEGIEVVLTREPGGTPLGEEIRDLVLHGGDVAPWAEAALYAASRAQHVEQLIRPALDAGRDRDLRPLRRLVGRLPGHRPWARSRAVLELNLAAVEGLMPDRTILLEIGADDAVGRMGGERDRIEREDDGFHARAARAYRQLAEREPDRFLVLDGRERRAARRGDLWGSGASNTMKHGLSERAGRHAASSSVARIAPLLGLPASSHRTRPSRPASAWSPC